MSSFPDLLASFDDIVEALKVKLSQDPTASITFNGELIQSIAKDIKDEWAAIQALVGSALSFETKALMNGYTPSADEEGFYPLAKVWNDSINDNNGLYGYVNGSGWEKSPYDESPMDAYDRFLKRSITNSALDAKLADLQQFVGHAAWSRDNYYFGGGGIIWWKSPTLYIRGPYSKTTAWSSLVDGSATDGSLVFEDHNGQTDCLKMGHLDTLIYDSDDELFKIVSRDDMQGTNQHIICRSQDSGMTKGSDAHMQAFVAHFALVEHIKKEITERTGNEQNRECTPSSDAYFEEGGSRSTSISQDCFFKANVLHIREAGAYSDFIRDVTWEQLKAGEYQDGTVTFETSPGGVPDCIRLGYNDSLVYDTVSHQYRIIESTPLTPYRQLVLLRNKWGKFAFGEYLRSVDAFKRLIVERRLTADVKAEIAGGAAELGSDSDSSIYLKWSKIYFRGGVRSGLVVTITDWDVFMDGNTFTDGSLVFADSPNGVKDCIKLDLNQMLAFDLLDNKLKVVDYNSAALPHHFPVITNNLGQLGEGHLNGWVADLERINNNESPMDAYDRFLKRSITNSALDAKLADLQQFVGNAAWSRDNYYFGGGGIIWWKSPTLYIRGPYSKTTAWSSLVDGSATDGSLVFEDHNGQTDCLKMGHLDTLIYDSDDELFKIVSRDDMQGTNQHIICRSQDSGMTKGSDAHMQAFVAHFALVEHIKKEITERTGNEQNRECTPSSDAYFEEGGSRSTSISQDCFFKANMLYIREAGAYSDFIRDVTWEQLKAGEYQDGTVTFETSPGGVPDCIRLGYNDSLVYDTVSHQYRIIESTPLTPYRQLVLLRNKWGKFAFGEYLRSVDAFKRLIVERRLTADVKAEIAGGAAELGSDSDSSIYLKWSKIYFRGGVRSGLVVTITDWDVFMDGNTFTDGSLVFADSPNGVKDCIKLDLNQMLAFDLLDNKLKVVDYNSAALPHHFPVITNKLGQLGEGHLNGWVADLERINNIPMTPRSLVTLEPLRTNFQHLAGTSSTSKSVATDLNEYSFHLIASGPVDFGRDGYNDDGSFFYNQITGRFAGIGNLAHDYTAKDVPVNDVVVVSRTHLKRFRNGTLINSVTRTDGLTRLLPETNRTLRLFKYYRSDHPLTIESVKFFNFAMDDSEARKQSVSGIVVPQKFMHPQVGTNGILLDTANGDTIPEVTAENAEILDVSVSRVRIVNQENIGNVLVKIPVPEVRLGCSMQMILDITHNSGTAELLAVVNDAGETHPYTISGNTTLALNWISNGANEVVLEFAGASIFDIDINSFDIQQRICQVSLSGDGINISKRQWGNSVQNIHFDIVGNVEQSHFAPITSVEQSGSKATTVGSRFNADRKFIAHRGMHVTCPENSLDAYKFAARCGFDMAETDIGKTSDGVLVLLHDDTLDRTCEHIDGTPITGGLRLDSLTFADLRANYRLKSSNPRYRRPVPTMEEWLIVCRDYGVMPMIEIKTGSGTDTSDVEATIDMANRIVGRGKFTVTSFSQEFLDHARTYDADCWLHYIPVPSVQHVADRAPAAIYPNYTALTQAIVDECKQKEVPVSCWTVPINQMNDLINLGVDQFSGDYICPKSGTVVEANSQSNETFLDWSFDGSSLTDGRLLVPAGKVVRFTRAFDDFYLGGLIVDIDAKGGFSVAMTNSSDSVNDSGRFVQSRYHAMLYPGKTVKVEITAVTDLEIQDLQVIVERY